MGSEHSREFREALEDFNKATERSNGRGQKEALDRLGQINNRAARRVYAEALEKSHSSGGAPKKGPCADQAMMMVSFTAVGVFLLRRAIARKSS